MQQLPWQGKLTHAWCPSTAPVWLPIAVSSGKPPSTDADISTRFPRADCAGELSKALMCVLHMCWIQQSDPYWFLLALGLSVQCFYALKQLCAFSDSKVSESMCSGCLDFCMFPLFWRKQKMEYELDSLLTMWQLMCVLQFGHCCWNKGKIGLWGTLWL